jgi:hypothetical protein
MIRSSHMDSVSTSYTNQLPPIMEDYDDDEIAGSSHSYDSATTAQVATKLQALLLSRNLRRMKRRLLLDFAASAPRSADGSSEKSSVDSSTTAPSGHVAAGAGSAKSWHVAPRKEPQKLPVSPGETVSTE